MDKQILEELQKMNEKLDTLISIEQGREQQVKQNKVNVMQSIDDIFDSNPHMKQFKPMIKSILAKQGVKDE